MLKRALIIIAGCFSLSINAQQEQTQFIRKHLVRADASIVPGFFINHSLSNVYINGNGEYYAGNTLSIRGDLNYMVGSTGFSEDSMGLKDNHSVLLGAVFHKRTNNHFDPYLILQPGIAYTSSYKSVRDPETHKDLKLASYSGALSPVATAGLGFNYYFQRFAHLFFETRYVYGRHLSEAPHPLSLQEIRVTFGLGFNAFVVKEKKRPV